MNLLIILTAQYLYFIPVIYFGAALIFSPRRKSLIVLALCAFPIAFLLVKLMGLLIQSPRPFVLGNIQPLIPHAADNGFPSDHTLLTMTIAAIIFTFNRKAGVILSLIALVVGLSRVLAKVHHPIDILGGIAIAVVSVSLSWYILKKNRDSNNAKKVP